MSLKKLQLKNRYGLIKIEGEYSSMKQLIKKSVELTPRLAYDFSYTDFSGYDLSGMSFKNFYLQNCNFSDTNLSSCDLSNADMSNCIFSNTNLEKAKLGGTQLYNINFTDMNYALVNFSYAKYGQDMLYIPPLQINNIEFNVTITPYFMQINGEQYRHSDWEKFVINSSSFESNKLEVFWQRHKDVLLQLCKIHKEDSEVKRVKYEGF